MRGTMILIGLIFLSSIIAFTANYSVRSLHEDIEREKKNRYDKIKNT